MPADPSAGGVFIDEGLNEAAPVQAKPLCEPRQQDLQEGGPGIGSLQPAPFQVVAPAKGGDTTQTEIAQMLIRPEAQALEMRRQLGLLNGGHDVGPIVEPIRFRRRRRKMAEQVGLERRHDSASSPGVGWAFAFSRLEMVTPTRRIPLAGG